MKPVGRHKMTFGRWCLLGLCFSSLSCQESIETEGGENKTLTADETYRLMVDQEETIAELVRSMGKLNRAIKNLEVSWNETLFTKEAIVLDLRRSELCSEQESPSFRRYDWEIESEGRTLTTIEGGMWKALWKDVMAFEDSRLGTLEGEKGKGEGTFVTKLKFSARGLTADREQGSWKGKIKVSWLKQNDQWLISRIEPLEFKSQVTSFPFFEEVLARSLRSPEDFMRASNSIHERYIREVFLTGGTKFTYPRDYWEYITSWDSLDQHTSVSVVDIDRDGWDDFYVTARWGKNQLWRNQGDGTFEDVAAKVGLDLDGVCNCSLFADFDNDGDQDVFIGRSLERGRFYENVDGMFRDRSLEKFDKELPYWISSAASADVNGDGLLDLYLSTYRLPITRPRNVMAEKFLTPEEMREWKRRRGEDHPVFRMTGPPNVLLMNRGGGRFETVPQAGGADLWLSTFQSTWSDYDNDGDPDLFVANDYAPDYVFRNDGGKLIDVTKELAGDEIQGFGMGVTLGDYNNDGLQDPYFTYMYSKAGSRITAMFGQLETRMYEGVAGNKLLENTGSVFENSCLPVAQTGWSWGGQFADFNNDGFLDIYVANGLYTPPRETETEVDL
ncbi:MAG: FG-GAP repeat domain-containing protein [Akkermansiaceae bacterium]